MLIFFPEIQIVNFLVPAKFYAIFYDEYFICTVYNDFGRKKGNESMAPSTCRVNMQYFFANMFYIRTGKLNIRFLSSMRSAAFSILLKIPLLHLEYIAFSFCCRTGNYLTSTTAHFDQLRATFEKEKGKIAPRLFDRSQQ